MGIEDKVKNLIDAIVVENGYRIDNVEYVMEGKTYFLRVVIDKSGIIDVEDCVNVCRLINPILDEADLVKDSYILDVCSKEKGSVENG